MFFNTLSYFFSRKKRKNISAAHGKITAKYAIVIRTYMNIGGKSIVFLQKK